MKTGTLSNTLQTAWVIAMKDIQDVLRNKNGRTNILVILGIVIFFYWIFYIHQVIFFNQVYDKVYNQVRSQVDGQVRDQVRNQIYGKVYDQIYDQVLGHVGRI